MKIEPYLNSATSITWARGKSSEKFSAANNMSVDINQGENFYCQTFTGLWVPDELAMGMEIAPKIWAGRGLPVVPGEHWEKWLGEIAFRDIRTSLVLTVTAPEPLLGHFFNAELKRKLDYLTFGLILQGVPDYRESFLIGGANETGQPVARQVSRARVFYPGRGSELLRVGPSELRRAVFLATELKSVDNKGNDWRRLRRAFDALTKGSAEQNLQDERIHQFVRSLEGLILPDKGNTEKQFVHRLQTAAQANNKTQESLREIFNIRSKVEHLHNALDALSGPTTEAKEALLYRRSRQVDQLARFAISRILETSHLREIFKTDESIAGFWSKKDHERATLWGNRLDLDEIA